MVKREEGFQRKERAHFDRLAEETGEIWWGSTTPAGLTRLRRRGALIHRQLKIFRDPLVLELGCGTGTFTKHVLENRPELRLFACDISPKSIRVVLKRYSKYKAARFGVVDVSFLPFPAGPFDAVIGNSVLHHLPLETCLDEVFRVLRPGGKIIFFEPNMLNPQVALEKNVRFIGERLQNTEDETAFLRWGLGGVLREAGFKEVSVKPFDFLHPGIPEPLIGLMDKLGKVLEAAPLLKEISGSLFITASKPE